MKKLLCALPILVLLLLPIAPVYAFTGHLDGRVVFGQSFTLQSGQTLDGDLSAFQEEGLSTQDVASRGVSTQRGALTGSVPNFRSSRVIE